MATTAFMPSFPRIVTAPRAPRMEYQPPRRRRPSKTQGEALSMLSHAIEYLIDSRLPEGGTTPAENQAVRLLIAASRHVFEECPIPVPLTHRVTKWIVDRLVRPAAITASH